MLYSLPTPHTRKAIGKILRTHGNNGQLLATIDDAELDNCTINSFIFILLQNKLVPFRIADMYIKSRTAYIIFEDIDSADAAMFLIGKTIYTHNTNTQENTSSLLESLIGYTLYNNNIKIGTITDAYEYSLNTILNVKRIDNEQEILIPYNKELVDTINSESATIHMNLPEGILDLNE